MISLVGSGLCNIIQVVIQLVSINVRTMIPWVYLHAVQEIYKIIFTKTTKLITKFYHFFLLFAFAYT